VICYEQQIMKPYKWLAKYYDSFLSNTREFDLARETVLGDTLKRAEAVCDLACGTGRTAIGYAKRGLRVYGVDLSPGMCRQANANARAAGLKVQVIQADMRAFRLPEKVDAISCEYDALNHVPEKQDLARVLRCVASALKPGGVFYFDVNMRLAFERNWRLSWTAERNGVMLVTQGGYVEGADRAWIDVNWFVRQQGNTWKRHREHVEEVCWSDREMRAALKAAGFRDIQTWDSAQFFENPMFGQGYRTFYLARKAASK
jgi:SAM-dependent methyltransferase